MSYRDLKSYQQSAVIYDFTVEFCNKYIDWTNTPYSASKSYKQNTSNRTYTRTHDQMVQAARSGKQNIVEGSSNPTSEKSELKLLGVARASFQELLEDYEDFLRQRGMRKWNKDEPAALTVRNSYKSNPTDKSYKSYLDDPEIAANAAICLINQVNFLLDRQISACEKEFVSRGDYDENLSKKRNEIKKREIINRELRKYE
ncbi:MAG TPA: four helix bundle suffix domain-containing protein [Candidatus Paceibacterota bacterium]|nr:four helix bundle suffix domain-containing protein [Candidatus Paceibacterota bacterium]